MATLIRIKGTTLLIVLAMFASAMISSCHAQLSPDFYNKTCPNALSTIRTAVGKAVSEEHRMGASLLRLHFHDCFVHGCDASLLWFDGEERFARPNINSLRGFEVIDNVKEEVEKVCPGVVSCADILAVAARDATVALGGPSWVVQLGRRDATTDYPEEAVRDIPNFNDDLKNLTARFQEKGFSTRDLVALSGAHTIGKAQCNDFKARIYNGTDIDPGFASTLRRSCSPDGGFNVASLDLVTPLSFDNNYFKNLMRKKGLLASDQVLYSGGETDSIVEEYSRNPALFMADFAAAMIKMGNLSPLTGSQGQIREICSEINN